MAQDRDHILQPTLDTLLKMHDLALADYNQKRDEVSRIQKELSTAGVTIDNLAGTIRVIQAQMGIAEENRIEATNNGHATSKRTVTQIVLEIIGEHDSKGGITLQDIRDAARSRGVQSEDDYFSAVFYRLQRKRKIIQVIDQRWYLTDKGRSELSVNERL